ncbi:MAG: hypothetical protein AAB511_04340 [Patescibacteria group bacterium]
MFEKISPKSDEYTTQQETEKLLVDEGVGQGSWSDRFLAVIKEREVAIKNLEDGGLDAGYLDFVVRREKRYGKLQEPIFDHTNSEEVVAFLKRRNEETLQFSVDRFIDLAKNQETVKSAHFIISGAMASPELRRQIYGTVHQPEGLPNYKKTVSLIAESFDRGEFPMETWRAILEHNSKTFWEKTKIFKEKVLPELKLKLLEFARVAIAEGILPLSEEDLRKAIDATGFALTDPTDATLEKMGGKYDVRYNVIFLASHAVDSYLRAPNYREEISFQDKFPDIFGPASKSITKLSESDTALVDIFCHEVIHMISGKTIVAERQDLSDNDPLFEHKKIGVRHVGKEVSRFRWLNEGITDYLTAKIMKDDSRKHVAYKKEVELFELLMIKGKVQIPLGSFTDAFFESFDPNQPKEQQLQHWKKLRAKLAEAYDHDFIVGLDRKIQEGGIDKGIDLVKNYELYKMLPWKPY